MSKDKGNEVYRDWYLSVMTYLIAGSSSCVMDAVQMGAL